ncbi:MAG TPA: ribonuclease E/G, partial [Paracoccaceae bacterium]|nr:ribonuclease E/G [Paracoccaceae bacterium]
AKDFMKMIMPSHAKNVKLYGEGLPLFARHQVESYLASMFNPTVQLKSGGYIVIGVTEALVAIDVNSGRSTKEGSIEETALKTNLEAADEIARQLRLRDLAGLIVVDFIDMEERKNNAAVEKRFKDKLKTDRARIQVGRISGFGLLEMSRQRLRPGMLESTTQPCPHCHGTGLIRSDDSMALQILRALEEEGTRKRSKEVLLRAPVAVVNFLMNQKREHIALIEARYGMSVRIEADPSLVSPDYHIEKFKTATRVVHEVSLQVIQADASLMGAAVDEDEDFEDEIEEAEVEVEAEVAEAPAPREAREPREAAGPDGAPGKKKRRRRRRRRGGAGGQADGLQADGTLAPQDGDEDEGEDDEDDAPEAAEAVADAVVAEAPVVTEAPAAPEAEPAPKTRSVSRSSARSRKPKATPTPEAAPEAAAVAEAPAAEAVVAEKPKAKAPSRSRKPKATEAAPAPEAPAPEPAPEPAPAAVAFPADPAEGLANAETLAPDPGDVAVMAAPEPAPAPAAAEDSQPDPSKPRRKGWWSLGR